MTVSSDFERRLADFYAAEAPRRAPDWVLRSALTTIEGTAQRRQIASWPWGAANRRLVARLAIAAAVLLGIGAVGLAVNALNQAPDDDSPPTPTIDPSTLVWSPDRLDQDWPVPVRAEPDGVPVLTKVALGPGSRWDSAERRWEPLEFSDAVGDVGGERPWLDIRKVDLRVGGTTVFGILLGGKIERPLATPADSWIAYGVVIDRDGDGVGDDRVGIDNLPTGEHRAWQTDLATGLTRSAVGAPYAAVGTPEEGRVGLDTYYPGDAGEPGDNASLWYDAGRTPPGFRVYAWASLIEDGRVVATDYAPDVGWLVEGDQPGQTLVGAPWWLDSEIVVDGQSMTLVQTLLFNDDGTMTLDAGCDTGTASFEEGPDRLRVTDITLVHVGCSDVVAQLTETFMSVLSAGEIEYSLGQGTLELRAGSDVLRFRANYEGPPPG